MTVPVQTASSGGSEKISMTSPVTAQQRAAGYEVRAACRAGLTGVPPATSGATRVQRCGMWPAALLAGEREPAPTRDRPTRRCPS